MTAAITPPVTPRPSDWLLGHACNIHSQSGEDGILAEIFRLIPATGPRWAVEFGAWDGRNLSNTCKLLTRDGWHGVLIEPEPGKYAQLTAFYAANKNVTCLREFVTFEGPGSLDSLLARTSCPERLDLLSIDIDGNDYHIWDSLRRVHPKVVVIEFNPSIPHNIAWTQPRDMTVRQGSSLRSITELASAKGYELVCATELNGIYVAREYFERFAITDNSLDTLHTDRQYITQVFQLYDGTLVWHGCKQMLWHNVPIRAERMQVLPEKVRFFVDSALPADQRKLLDEELPKLR